MECTLTQPEDNNQKREEGAAAQAYEEKKKKKVEKLIAADQTAHMTYIRTFITVV